MLSMLLLQFVSAHFDSHFSYLNYQEQKIPQHVVGVYEWETSEFFRRLKLNFVKISRL